MKRLLILFLLCASSASAQGFRFSNTVQRQATVGTATNVVTLPATPIVSFCAHPANAVPCTNVATTFTSQTLVTPCGGGTQIVLDGTTTCVASPDAQDNWGVWVASGQYDYTITLPGGINLGPFFVSMGVPSATPLSISGAVAFTGSFSTSGASVSIGVSAGSPLFPQGLITGTGTALTIGTSGEINFNGAAGFATGFPNGATASYNTTTQAFGLSNNNDTAAPIARIGSGSLSLKHQRFAGNLGGTCPTAAAIGAPCTSGNLNWTAAFADNNYTVTCSLQGAMTAQPHIVSIAYQAAGVGITITIAADTAAATNVAPTGFTDCVAIHD